MESHLLVRLAFAAHERLGGTWASTLLVSGYGLACFLSIAPPQHRRPRVMMIAKHANARRQLRQVASWISPDDCGFVRAGRMALFDPSGLSSLGVAVASGRLRQVLRIVRAIDARHGFLVACRAANAIAWYARATLMLDTERPGAVVVSSDSQPEEMGFVAAARGRHIPQVFVSHAYPTPLSPPLDFSLSILEGEAALRARRRKGPIEGDVLLAGVEGESAPLDVARFARPNPVIGICTPKAVAWPVLVKAINDCREYFRAARIVIRWHPSMLERPRLAHWLPDRSLVMESPRSAALADVVRECDWIIADENSNVHLPVLKMGIPTIALKHLGIYPPSRADQYGFVAGGVIFPPVASIRDVQPAALSAFFVEGWPARFKQYDASYLRPGEAVRREVRRAIFELLDGPIPQALNA